MKTLQKFAAFILLAGTVFYFSCQKEISQRPGQQEAISTANNSNSPETPPYDLNVILQGEGNRIGHLKFRQDPDPAKIIDLEIKVHHLEPDHEYLLQRAVDAINVVDGNCTSTSWLTLGKGLTPQSILTDAHGKGSEDLWRDVTMIPSGSMFDIHFRVVDKTNMAVVLASGCYQYTVR